MDMDVRKIKYHGPIDIFGLYNLIAGWMSSKGYVVYNPTTKHKVTGGGLEYKYVLEGVKKETEYYKSRVFAEFKIKDAKEIEVTKNQVKKKILNGTLYINIGGKIIRDMQGLYVNSPFEVGLLNFMNKHIKKERSENFFFDRVDYKLVELQTRIKEFIDMNSKGNAYHDAW